jgi:hypothetical protein
VFKHECDDFEIDLVLENECDYFEIGGAWCYFAFVAILPTNGGLNEN